jgi:hypothetical protein
MTETSAAAYMASNCSFAPTGPIKRQVATANRIVANHKGRNPQEERASLKERLPRYG